MINIDNTPHKYTAGFNAVGAVGSIGLLSLFPRHHGSDVTNTYLFDDSSMQMLLYFGAMMITIGSLWNAHEIRKENKSLTTTATNTNTAANTNASSFKHLSGAGIAVSLVGIAILSAAVLYAFDAAFLHGAIFDAPRSNAGPDTTSQKVIFSAIYASIAMTAAASTYAQVKMGKTLLQGPRQQ